MMHYVLAIVSALALVVLGFAFTIRTNKWRNRRSGKDRREVADRRVNPGRRIRDSLTHESTLCDRRQGDRRVGPVTRRHRKRRRSDRFGQG